MRDIEINGNVVSNHSVVPKEVPTFNIVTDEGKIVECTNQKPPKEYNMRVFKKKHDDGTYSLYIEEGGKVWELKGGDFCGKLDERYELLIEAEKYRNNFYA